MQATKKIIPATNPERHQGGTSGDDDNDDDVDDVDDDDNDDAKNFRRRENFRKTRSGRHDRFRPKIVEIGAILAIFEPRPAWNTRNVLLGTQGTFRMEHKEYPACQWNTRTVLLENIRNVLLGTKGMSCLKHTECFARNTKNVLLGAQRLSSLKHRKFTSAHLKLNP